MLMQLGTVTFDVQPFNTHEYESSSVTDYARKDVVGARRPLEHMGEGEETMSIMGRLLPKHLGGLSELAQLHAMRQAGQSVFMMRGDGKPMGWFVIEAVDESSTQLARDGVGQLIDFSVHLVRAPKPSVDNFLFSLFETLLPQ